MNNYYSRAVPLTLIGEVVLGKKEMSMNIENMVEKLSEELGEKELKIMELEKKIESMVEMTPNIKYLLNEYMYYCDKCDDTYKYNDMEVIGDENLYGICKKCDGKMYDCLYCGCRDDASGWVSERCRKEGKTENMKDHPECEYKGYICGSCEWENDGEMMCYMCQKFNNFYQGNNQN